MIKKSLFKKLSILMAAFLLSVSSPVSALAGTWTTGRGPDPSRLWYDFGGGSFIVGAWTWIDGYCYCFDENGYLYTSCTTPDFHQVDELGRLTVNGQVQVEGSSLIDPTHFENFDPAEGIQLGSWSGDTYSNSWSNYQITLPTHLYEDFYNPPRSGYDNQINHFSQDRFCFADFRKKFYDFSVTYTDKTIPASSRPTYARRHMRMGYYNLHQTITPEILQADIAHYIRYSTNTWLESKGEAFFDGYADVTIAGDPFIRIRWVLHPDKKYKSYSDCYFRALDDERIVFIETNCYADYLPEMENTVQSLSKITPEQPELTTAP